jgi:hypothetical protein
VLLGGHDGDRVLGDAWSWDGVRWQPLRDLPPEPRVENGH